MDLPNSLILWSGISQNLRGFKTANEDSETSNKFTLDKKNVANQMIRNGRKMRFSN